MEIIKTKNINSVQFQQIDQMWNDEYPIKLKDRFGILLEGVENYNHYLIEQNNNDVSDNLGFRFFLFGIDN